MPKPRQADTVAPAVGRRCGATVRRYVCDGVGAFKVNRVGAMNAWRILEGRRE